MTRPLILASTSKWRRKMLEDAGIAVELCASGVDERAVHDPDPARLAGLLARAKAKEVFQQHPERWVLGADQVGHLGDEAFGKPADPDDHFARLASLRGHTHHLSTGWCLLGPEGVQEGVCRTALTVRADLSDDELWAYVRTGEGSGCAGGYAVEGLGGFLFERIEGDWFNVVGLPLLDVMTALRRWGWRALEVQG